MKIDSIELRRLTMPLRNPFRTSFGTEAAKELLLLRVLTADGEGWGECVAMDDPLYCSEYIDGAEQVLKQFLIPAIQHTPDQSASAVAAVLARYRGHRMAKAALEMAVMDAELRVAGLSFGHALGAVTTRVPSGVSVGIMDTIGELLDAVSGYLEEGYVRIKLKIEPGWDLEPVIAVREQFGDVKLQVDANTAYTLDQASQLAALDDFDLLMIEQPLDEEDLLGHAELSRRLRTPICLDESIVSTRGAAAAIELDACQIVNIKPGRVGGYLEARRIHDFCTAAGIPVWCGGMVETGIGRAGNLALAGLPGFTLPGDLSASSRFFQEDLTEPFVLHNGGLTIPTGPGLGVTPLPSQLQAFTTKLELIHL